MKKLFITYEQALALKELGFDEPCLGYYNSISKEFYNEESYGNFEGAYKYRITAPLYHQAFTWFRDKYSLEFTTNIITVKPFSTLPIEKTYTFSIIKTDEVSTERRNKSVCTKIGLSSSEELELECIYNLIEIVKKINIGIRI